MTKYRSAVAIEYEDDDETAPVISAAGDYLSADEIVRIATRYGVPVVERKGVARSLRLLEIGESIPAELYRIIAIIFNELEVQLGKKRSVH